jgi:Mg2+ and Co2+ transporter CorA
VYVPESQIDNSLNAILAEAAARDSRAMKTLALITTMFLPATFVATLFSVSMFSWMAGQGGSKTVVSSRFKIY